MYLLCLLKVFVVPAVHFRVYKAIEVPEVPVAAVQELVGHHCQQEGEESQEEPGVRQQLESSDCDQKLHLQSYPQTAALSPHSASSSTGRASLTPSPSTGRPRWRKPQKTRKGTPTVSHLPPPICSMGRKTRPPRFHRDLRFLCSYGAGIMVGVAFSGDIFVSFYLLLSQVPSWPLHTVKHTQF